MILVDAGPLIALVDANDQHHAECMAALKNMREPMATVWPPLTEAMYLLADQPRAQESLWEMVERGALQLLALDSGDAPRIRELMRKYANRPMDLADAALLRVAEREGIRKIFTVDRRDFSVYRLHGRVRPTLLP
jgi:predicted nucleic acid-binding protein